MSQMLKRFKKKLIDLGLKQTQVANHFGWSSQYVRDLMGGMTAGPAAEKNRQAVNEYLDHLKGATK